MTYLIEFLSSALIEEADAYLFYESQLKGLGDKFLLELESALSRVTQNPSHYSYSDWTKTVRDISLDKFPFVIIFQVLDDKIIVYNIHHTKKNSK